MELQPNDPEFDEKKLDGVRLKFQEQSTSPAVKNGRPVEVSSEIAQLSQTIDAEASRNIEDLLLEIASLKEKFTRASSECDAQNHLISKLQASNITLKKHAMELNIANDEIRSTMKIFLNIADQLKQREPPVHSQEEREMMKFSERAAMIMQCTTVQSFAQPVEFLDRSSTEKRASKDKRKSTVTNRIERPKTPSVNQNFNDQHPNMMTLMQFPLFASFPKGIMELVSLASYEMRRRAGQVIIKKGDEAAEIYFLTSGSVSVSVDEQEVTKLQAPVFFGELGVLFKFKRSATVIATTDSDMVVVTKQKLEEIVSIDPAVKASVEYFSTNKEAWWKNQQYVLSQEKFGGEFANDIARKGLRNMEIFSAAPDAFVDSLAMILKCLVFKPNENIVTIDEESDAMYFVLSGQVEVVGNTGVVHAEILPGSFFGEVGVLLNMKRTASIRAKVETSLFKLTKEDLDKVVVNYPSMKSTLQAAVNERYALIQRRRSSIQTNAENSSSIPDQFDIEVAAQFLAKLTLFEGIDSSILSELGMKMVRKTWTRSDLILKCGTVGDSMFFLAAGNAEVMTEFDEVIDEVSGPSAYFGEVAIIEQVPRTASVRCTNTCSTYELRKDDFKSVMDKYPDIAKKIKQTAEIRMQNYLMRSVLA